MQVFDAFSFDNQLDMLEIRLLELNATVDFFVLCERILLPIIVRASTQDTCLRLRVVLCYLLHLSGMVCKTELCMAAVESNETMLNEPKPLHYAENSQRFASFADKIVHVLLDTETDDKTSYRCVTV